MDIDSDIVVVTLHNGDRFGGDNEKMSKQLIMEVQRQAPAASVGASSSKL